MILIARFFSVTDIILVPICLIILFAIIRAKASKYKGQRIQKLYYQAFYFKLFCVLCFTLVTEFYFKGGDTGLFYQGIKDLRAAIKDDISYLPVIIKSLYLDASNPLFPYFFYDNYADDFTYNYMRSPSNFFVPKLGLVPSLLFFNNYICINLFFGFFALGGAIRLFKTFYHFYPDYWRELAIAILFLPSVGFWSAGLLKDPICFGAIGFIMYGALNIFVRKKNIFSQSSGS